MTTTSDGRTVPYIVRREMGTINRAVYSIAILHEPGTPLPSPWMKGTWNGKLVTTGNGGYSNALSYRDMANALAQGYAAVGGDTGHQSAADDLLWGQGHPEKIIDWGSRSIHAITIPARRIVAHLAGRPATRAYYYGCSTGGHQAYAEMQRYPEIGRAHV